MATSLLVPFSLVILTVIASPVQAVDTSAILQLQGAIDVDHDEKHEDEWDSRDQLELGLEGEAGEALSYKVSGRFKGDFYGNGDSREDLDLEVYETYLKYSGERFDLKIGNLVVQWGKMDELVLTDNVNAHDLDQFIIPWKEDRKLATPMAQTEIYLGDSSLELLVSPRPYIHRFTFFDSDWALFRHRRDQAPPFEELSVEVDAPDWGDVEYGGRWRSTIGELDYAVSALVYHQRTPVFRQQAPSIDGVPLTLAALFAPQDVEPLLANPQTLNAFLADTTVKATYPWVVTIGGELETIVGDYGVRAEIAHTFNAEYLAKDLSVVEADQTLFGLGIDLTLDEFYGNLQAIHQWIQEDTSLLITGQQATTLVLVLEYETLQGTVTPAFYAAWDLGDNASYLRPRVLYKQSDHLTLDLGLHIFTGDEDTALGSFDANDQAYLLATVSF